jgi:hypothetical protein
VDRIENGDNAPIHVQCVYGTQHIPHIARVLLPTLARATRRPVIFTALNYCGCSDAVLSEGAQHGVLVRCVSNPEARAIGFAAGHNRIFHDTRPRDCFVLLNPDCIPQVGAIDALLARRAMAKGAVAIVEGRQWPFEHPKEYDKLTLQTPWASAAFCLVDVDFYSSVDGMDEVYFLYLEDVDLSWQAWLSGYQVLYEPAASVVHFTSGRFYRQDLVSNEAFYSLRNSLLLARKFFGASEEAKLRKSLLELPDKELSSWAIEDYDTIDGTRIGTSYIGMSHPKVKLLGYDRFHEMRDF